MPELNESETPSKGRNPLVWIAVIVIGLIVFVFVSSDRGEGKTAQKTVTSSESGTIDRSLLVPPGMRAREFVRQLREDGKPYPLDMIHEKATQYLQDGSLADAHLLFYFAAREDHLGSIMVMGEMSDPILFQPENSLLDHADVIQAYKWYQRATTLGHEAAAERIDSLRQWALLEADSGNVHARQFLLNFD